MNVAFLKPYTVWHLGIVCMGITWLQADCLLLHCTFTIQSPLHQSYSLTCLEMHGWTFLVVRWCTVGLSFNLLVLSLSWLMLFPSSRASTTRLPSLGICGEIVFAAIRMEWLKVKQKSICKIKSVFKNQREEWFSCGTNSQTTGTGRRESFKLYDKNW